jgi:hypothetical protein
LSFRQQEKERLAVEIPIPVARLVREKAGRERRSVSYTTCELLCLALSLSPEEFGIMPRATRSTATA